MAKTPLFQSNKSQPVRLPETVAFPDGVHSLTILRDGPRRIITPADAVWDDFFDAPGLYLGERRQTDKQEREAF